VRIELGLIVIEPAEREDAEETPNAFLVGSKRITQKFTFYVRGKITEKKMTDEKLRVTAAQRLQMLMMVIRCSKLAAYTRSVSVRRFCCVCAV